MEPSSPPCNKRVIPNNRTNYWSVFSEQQEDLFVSPKNRRSATSTPSRSLVRKKRLHHNSSSSIQSNEGNAVSEFTPLLLPSPICTTRDEDIGAQKYMSGGNVSQDFKFSSPHRSLVRGRPQTPLSSSSNSKTSKVVQPLLLQSMRYWNVGLPPPKKHMVDGKLVDTFRGSLYGNDRNRTLPIAKRRLTIELFGNDQDTNLWGNRKRRNFSELEKNRDFYCASGASSCGDISRLSDPSWVLMKGASNDDLSLAKSDWMSDTDSSGNDRENSGYYLAERDVVVLRVMKSRIVTQYDDEFGLGDSSINSGLRERKWESQSISDRTMSWMEGSEGRDEYDDRDENLMNKHMRWIELSRTRLSQIELVREDFEANEVDLEMGVGARTVVQTFRFDGFGVYDIRENIQGGNARTFAKLFRLLKWLEKERAQDLAASHRCLLSEKDLSRHAIMGGSAHNNSLRQESSISASSNGNGKTSEFGSEGENKEACETVSILLEIVSACNLPTPGTITSESSHDGINPHYTGVAENKNVSFPDPEIQSSIDPYVVIRDGKTDIHSTSFISDSLDPIWTLSTGSFHLLQSDIVNFFKRSNVLEFAVKNHEPTRDTEDPTIGTVMVHKTELLNGTGERKCFQILPPPSLSQMKSATKSAMNSTASRNREAPFLFLRYRQASAEDIDFIQNLQHETNQKNGPPLGEGVYASETFLPPQFHSPSLVDHSTEKKSSAGTKNSIPETEGMTETMTEEKSKDHSASWTMAGSGSIGRLYIEIMGCDGLSNKVGNFGEKVNPFVNIVFEDSVVNTEVINDCFSPRWMPGSQRAFVLNMMNLSSQIFISVFDYNTSEEIGGGNHDPLGRVVINLSSLRPRAIHFLTYSLYDSDEIDRQFRGTISVRLRLAIDDERKALISELSVRDHFSVSTVSESDFRCTAYSLTNYNPPHSMSLSRLRNDANELLGYFEIWAELTDALMVVLLWKGHFLVTLDLYFLPLSRLVGTSRRHDIQLNIPVHSMVAFAWATILAWDLTKLFSFFWFAIGWAFLATLENQRRHPSPWRRPRSYCELLRILFSHKSKVSVLCLPPLRRTIHPNERLAEIEHFESIRNEKGASRQTQHWISNDQREKNQDFPEQAESTVPLSYSTNQNRSPKNDRTKDRNVPTEKSSPSDAEFETAEAILFPIQRFFYRGSRLLRVCRSVILWRDAFLSFWITTLSFSAAFLAFWIPWLWFIQWGFRLFVWPFFGPWMKLVDIYYFQEMKNCYHDGEKVVFKSEIEIFLDLYNRWMEQEEVTAVSREDELKSKDMKRYMFGKYSIKVPIFQAERFPSEPAFSSSSLPYNTNPRPVTITRRIHGQLLEGNMVPNRHFNVKSEDEGGDA